MKKLLPLILALLGCVIGVGTGYLLRPDPEGRSGATQAAAPGDEAETASHVSPPGSTEKAQVLSDNPPEFVKLNNQFVVPVVQGGAVVAMVILSLSLEVVPGSSEAIYAREPKLRDVFLQVLFDHANSGGFRGTFTDSANLVVLRQALLEIARRTLGDIVTDVLIIDIARQDS